MYAVLVEEVYGEGFRVEMFCLQDDMAISEAETLADEHAEYRVAVAEVTSTFFDTDKWPFIGPNLWGVPQKEGA